MRANCNDLSSSSIMCREWSRNIVVGCGFGLNDHRLVAKSNPPRVNDVSNTDSFSDSELSEEALTGLRTGLGRCVGPRTGLWIPNGFVEDFGNVFVSTFRTFLTGDLPRIDFLTGIDFEDSARGFDFCFRGVFCLPFTINGSVITRTCPNFKVSEF